MPKTWQIGGYVSLARQAASIIGAPHDAVVEAILVHWQCEQPDPAPWPPLHNNPGNLTKAIGTEDGEPHRLATTQPGVGLLYVYATPEVGAAAYARTILAGHRWRSALIAARQANGRNFVLDLCTGGWGTRETCVQDLLPLVHLPTSVTTLPRWLVEAHAVNIRSGPTVAAPIVGHLSASQIVSGSIVTGGRYSAGGAGRTDWLHMASSRYSAAGFLRRVK